MRPEDLITEEIQKEREFNISQNFRLGEYIYMGMGLVGDHRVCLAVGYKIGYCLKKAIQFMQADNRIKFTHINKVKIGDMEACKKFEINNIIIN